MADRAQGLRDLKDYLEKQIKIFVDTTELLDKWLEKPAYGMVSRFMEQRFRANITWETFLEHINPTFYSSTLKSD